MVTINSICRCQRSKHNLRCYPATCLGRPSVIEEKRFKENWDALLERSSHGGRVSRASTVHKVAKQPIKKRRKRSRMCVLRKWARRSLAKRFCPSNEGDTHKETKHAGLSAPSGGNLNPVKDRKFTKIQKLCGNAKRSKLFVRALRRVLADLGIALVGPLPFALLERLWVLFGEGLVAPHGVGCWCVSCRSSLSAHMPIHVALGDVLVSYLKQMPVHVIFGLIVPAPFKTAKFVANKLWQWVKVLFPGYSSRIGNHVRQALERFVSWLKSENVPLGN